MARFVFWSSFSLALLSSAVPVQNSMFQCQSDYNYGPVAAAAKKGLAVDDTTYRWCSEAIPGSWPNAGEAVTSIRLFRAWDASWQDDRLQAYDNVKKFVSSNGAKVLLGVSITCSAEADAQEWQWAKDLIQLLGPDSMMGLAIGNEVELLFTKGEKHITPGCVEGLWDRADFWKRFTAIVKEFDELGFQDVPITSVFGGLALAGNRTRGEEFYEQPGKALVNSFFLNATEKYGTRFAWTWNVYPYFDPAEVLDEGSADSCEGARQKSLCWDITCDAPRSMAYYRKKMSRLTGRLDDIMWIGETGWNSQGGPNTNMKKCKNWASVDSLERYYANFLKWEVAVEEGQRPPDHVFYFSIRNSLNFGGTEHFGLIEQCFLNQCKLHSSEFEIPEPILPTAPGCYYQQPTEGNGACDGPWKLWKFDDYGLSLANSSSDSEVSCLGRKLGHDGFCGTDTRWLFVAPATASSTTAEVTTTKITTTTSMAGSDAEATTSTIQVEAVTTSTVSSGAEASTSTSSTHAEATTSMEGSSAGATTSTFEVEARTTSMESSGAKASESTSSAHADATTTSMGGSSAGATTSTFEVETGTTSMEGSGAKTSASTSSAHADATTTSMGGSSARATTSTFEVEAGTTSMEGSGAKASASTTSAHAEATTSIRGSSTGAMTSTSEVEAGTTSMEGSGAEASTSTEKAEATSTSMGGGKGEASTSITHVEAATTTFKAFRETSTTFPGDSTTPLAVDLETETDASAVLVPAFALQLAAGSLLWFALEGR